MAQDKITEIFDIQAIEANIAKAISAAKSALPELEKLGQNIKANTTIGGSSNNTAAANAAMAQFTQSLKEYTEAVKAAAAARINLSKVSDEEAAKQKVNSTALNAQLKEEIKLTSNLTGAYEKLNIQHKQAIKAYQDAAAAGKVSAQQLVVLKDNANKLGEQLVKIDAGVGNFRRNVGNYSSAWNGLGMSIQQVAREMPNFAQSMQLGFLAISNNLPILADEIKRTKENIAALKAEGKDAPSLFSQIAASVFSWQTLLTIGITLLVKYGASIVDWASNVSDVEKMMRNYEKALGDTIKSESEGISKLVAAKAAINDNSISREAQIKLLNEAKAAYPQLLSSLDVELNTTGEINSALQQQLDIRLGIAKTKAAEATLADATSEQIKAIQGLSKEFDFLDKVQAQWFNEWNALWTSQGWQTFYNGLTDSSKKLLDEQYKLYKSGEITKAQYQVMIQRISEVSDTQKKEASAIDLVRYATDDLTMSKVKQIDKLEKEIEQKKLSIRLYPGVEKTMTAEIDKIKAIITSLQGEISEREKLLNLKQARVASFGISEEERQLIAAQNYARTFKEGTKQRLDADIAAKKVERDLNLKNLKEKEKVSVSYLVGDLNYNQKYATLRQEIISKSDDEILRMQDDFNKKKAKAAKAANKPKPEDKTADIILQQMNDIAENEQININKRLTAIREELDKGLITIAQYQDKKKIIVKEGEDSILQLQIQALDDYLKKVGLQAEGRAKVQEMITTKHKEEIKRRQAADEEASLQAAKAREDEIAYGKKIDDDAEKYVNDRIKEQEKKRKEDADNAKKIEEEKYRYIQEIAKETTQLIFTLLDAQTQKEISAAEKRSEALTAEYELKRSAVEQANLSDEEKTARKLVLDAEEAESQRKIDNEIRALKIKQAKFDKAQALATIAINAAIALASAQNLGTLGALSPFIIGLAAAQAAVVLATPLPEYAKGKKASDSYEGLAIAGEKGTEMKIDKDGSLQLLTKPTLIHTKRGDTILSNKELMSGELGKHIKTGKEKANYDELIKAYSYHTDRTIKAIKNSPSNIIIDNSNYNLSLKRARV
jgi:hypothetical protein